MFGELAAGELPVPYVLIVSHSFALVFFSDEKVFISQDQFFYFSLCKRNSSRFYIVKSAHTRFFILQQSHISPFLPPCADIVLGIQNHFIVLFPV